jgi:sigma-B regulation protein RsbU (phosphoserine phosphatase)
VKLELKSRWKKLGKLEKLCVIVLALYLILLALVPAIGFTAFVQFVVICLAIWQLFRLVRFGLRKVIWRLRNRLVVAYLFIAVVPILLILTLAGLGAYMLAEQVAVYMVRSELDRTVASMREAAAVLRGSSPRTRSEILRRAGEIYGERFPGIILLIDDHGSLLQWPDAAGVGQAPGVKGDMSGVVKRDGRFYAWSCFGNDETLFLAAVPLSRRYLSRMTPGVGDVYFMRGSTRYTNSPGKAASRQPEAQIDSPARPRVVVTVNPADVVSGGNDRFELQAIGNEPAAGILPPPANRFDLNVAWFSLVPAAEWTAPQQSATALVMIHTRFSALMAVILSQKADEFQGLLPIFFVAVAIAFLLVEMVSLVIGVSLSRTITGAVHSLYEGTQRVMKSDFSHRIAVEGNDQLAELNTSFNGMTENLERLLAVAKEKERLQAEIEIAREVQEQLYPKTAPVLKGLQVTGMCQPARMVSGDYYDYQIVEGHRLAIAIGDVAGKGISAALLMSAIQSALRMELRTSLDAVAPSRASTNGFHLSTGRLVSDLNRQLYATTSPEKYATFCLALYDDETGVVTYTNAGHLPPILIGESGVTRLDVNGTVVGAFPLSKYDESKVQLRSGDILVWYTDGITEPENEYGEAFGEERMIDLVAKNAAVGDRHIIEILMDSVRQWTGTPELFDDMTVVLARKI